LIKSLHTENFRVLSGVRDYEFPEGIIGIVGPNGQGKSTLINSIAWAMYGQEALPLRAREPVAWGEKQCLVRVHLVLNDGQEWVVERSQKSSGSPKAKLYRPDGQVKAEGATPVTNAITELMGVDREGFLISVFARQFELDRLRSMDPTPRMQTVLRLLGINQITKAVKIVREKAGEKRKSLDALRIHQIDSEAIVQQIVGLSSEESILSAEVLTARGAMNTMKRNKERIDQERAELEPKRLAYQSYLNDLQAKKTTLQLAEATYDRAHKEVNVPEPVKPTEPEYKPVEQVDEQEIDRLKGEYLKCRDDYVELKARRDTLQAQIDNMQDVCPTCNRPFDGAVHREREKAAGKRKIESHNSSMEEMARLGEAAKERWDNAARRKTEADYVVGLNARLKEGYEAQLLNYEQAMIYREASRNRYASAQIDLSVAHEELESLVPVEDVSEADRLLLEELDIINQESSRVNAVLSAALANLENVERELVRLNEQLEQAQSQDKETKQLETDLVQHETTAQELQRLKETMIGGIIPSLNERASALIEQMTDGKYSELSLTPEYEIEYRNSVGDLKNFLNLSGGEQTVFALALRLAISDLRAGNLGVLFLDEAISNLSSEDGRQESVWQAIESLTSRFRQTFVITHVEAYKDRAPYSVVL
jgi:DNA repair protein SbcC/Rad50